MARRGTGSQPESDSVTKNPVPHHELPNLLVELGSEDLLVLLLAFETSTIFKEVRRSPESRPLDMAASFSSVSSCP